MMQRGENRSLQNKNKSIYVARKSNSNITFFEESAVNYAKRLCKIFLHCPIVICTGPQMNSWKTKDES